MLDGSSIKIFNPRAYFSFLKFEVKVLEKEGELYEDVCVSLSLFAVLLIKLLTLCKTKTKHTK